MRQSSHPYQVKTKKLTKFPFRLKILKESCHLLFFDIKLRIDTRKNQRLHR